MPRVLFEATVAGGPDNPAWGWANVVSAAVPLMERAGVATRAEVDPATLPGRLVAETLATGGCVICPPLTGAWTRTPGNVPSLSPLRRVDALRRVSVVRVW
jgi:hypothetical protein